MHRLEHLFQLLLEFFILGALVELADEVAADSKSIVRELQRCIT